MAINLKLLKEYKTLCDNHSIPFTFQGFDLFIAHISK